MRVRRVCVEVRLACKGEGLAITLSTGQTRQCEFLGECELLVITHVSTIRRERGKRSIASWTVPDARRVRVRVFNRTVSEIVAIPDGVVVETLIAVQACEHRFRGSLGSRRGRGSRCGRQGSRGSRGSGRVMFALFALMPLKVRLRATRGDVSVSHLFRSHPRT